MSLQDLIDSYVDEITRIDNQISEIEDLITDLETQGATLSGAGGPLLQAKTDMDAALISKASSNGWSTDLIWKSASHYGVTSAPTSSPDVSGSLGELNGTRDVWGIYNEISVTNLTYVDSNTFKVDGDARATFTIGRTVACGCGVDGVKRNDVSNATYAAGPNETTVDLTGQPGWALESITSNLTKVGGLVYQYNGTGWDSDTALEQIMTDFEFCYKHLYDPLNIDGTTGIHYTRNQYNDTVTILTANKTRYTDAQTIYDRYV